MEKKKLSKWIKYYWYRSVDKIQVFVLFCFVYNGKLQLNLVLSLIDSILVKSWFGIFVCTQNRLDTSQIHSSFFYKYFKLINHYPDRNKQNIYAKRMNSFSLIIIISSSLYQIIAWDFYLEYLRVLINISYRWKIVQKRLFRQLNMIKLVKL